MWVNVGEITRTIILIMVMIITTTMIVIVIIMMIMIIMILMIITMIVIMMIKIMVMILIIMIIIMIMINIMIMIVAHDSNNELHLGSGQMSNLPLICITGLTYEKVQRFTRAVKIYCGRWPSQFDIEYIVKVNGHENT